MADTDDTGTAFDTQAEEAIFGLFAKGFGTCRANSGEYTVQFRFQHLEDAQKAYRDLCMAYMRTVSRVKDSEERAARSPIPVGETE